MLTLVALHGLTYHAVWILSGTWIKKALDQGPEHNNLMGSIAFLFGLALWTTSLEKVRRSNYALFKATHHIGFWGFLVFGCCHKWDIVWGFLPGLVLYGIDGVYRLQQAVVQPAISSTSSTCGTVRVLHASVSPGRTMCSLVLSSPTYGVAGSGYVWLCVPGLSCQYHPFEYLAVPWGQADLTSSGALLTDGVATSTALLLHIKAYSR